MTIAIVVIVAIVVVIISVGFIFPGIGLTAHIRSDDEHPPMENVSDVLRLTLQKVYSMHGSYFLIGAIVNMLNKCVK